jgi:HPr kinase/phosphorylase
MTSAKPAAIHATCVAIGGQGVLIAGPSGIGKSDLALRLIDRGAILVSDDYTEIRLVDGALTGKAPATIAGKIEVRGVGILAMPFTHSARIRLIVRLGEDIERLPPGQETETMLALPVALVRVAAHEASAPIKVELALNRALEGL